jgi:hypothetical protein
MTNGSRSFSHTLCVCKEFEVSKDEVINIVRRKCHINDKLYENSFNESRKVPNNRK